MYILIPMAGAGQRFTQEGYRVHKPAIPVLDRRSGNTYPMVVCATMDLPGVERDGANIIYIDRDFHKKDGVEDQICSFYPKASFVTTDTITQGQACTCLLAKDNINTEEELLIAGCDNGMVFQQGDFEKQKESTDVIVFTFRHQDMVLKAPDAYGWMITNERYEITGVSIKKAVSNTPMEDHAVVSAFWFRHGCDFVTAAEKMIAEEDRVNGEFYVDQVIRHVLKLGMKAQVFEVERYIGWGTPKDYEDYMHTFQYWKTFVQSEGFLPGRKL